MKKFHVICFVFITLFAQTIKAQVTGYNSKPGWYKIGEKTVDFQADRDQININGADKFVAIQLRVTDARLRFEDLSVVYDLPGVTQEFKEDLSIRSDFKPGGRTRIIYLKYPCLNINKIVFFYGSVPNWRYERAHVEIYGLK